MSNNKIILNGCIDQFKNSNELIATESATFELFSLSQVTKHLDLAFEDIQESVVDGGNDGGIASIEDIEDFKFNRKTVVSILISQCKKESSFKESTIDKLITTIPELFNLEKSVDALLVRFNTDVVARALVAREVWKKCSIGGGQINVNYNYCAYAESVEVNSTYASKAEQLKQLTGTHFVGATISYSNYSCAELLKLYQTQRNERLSLRFKEAPLSTTYSDLGIGYVGTVKLADCKSFLADEDGSIRDDLFESNIRHFQGLVDVNKKIKETILRPGREDFWWLNNGITIIASNPSLVGTTLSIDNVQIVNGLQTSYSIFINHDGSTTDTRSVLVKVIINEDKRTIDHIIASTNSQNPVSPALLRATDDVQREIELLFLNSGFFYDRRKNYYKNQGKPVNRIFSIQTAAQAIESILYGNPWSARSKPTSLIKEDSAYNRIFNPNHSFKAYLNCCLICKMTIEFWGDIEDKSVKNKLSNFKLHLSRIASSFILSKSNFSAEQVSNVDLSSFNQDKFEQSISLMVTVIEEYQLNNPDANLINMAKTKGLTDLMIQRLNEKFTSAH
jgi:hypothetical protein